MKDKKDKDSSILNDSILGKSNSVFSVAPSRYSRLLVCNQEIVKKMQKLNSISQSVDISAITKNPLNMIEYEMQGQKSRHDPQMILAKLRKLENRAELHRASNELNLLDQQKSRQQLHAKRLANRVPYQEPKRQQKLNYLKIYQTYMKQKQIEAEHRQRFEDDEIEVRQEEEFDQTKDGVKFFNSLKKHPRLLDLTLSRKKAKQGITQRQIQTQRKTSLTKAVKLISGIDGYQEEKLIEKQKEAKCFIQNPQKVIQRQITKFYLKKNPGTLSSEAENNQRSINLMNRQKQISFHIDQEKISKEDKKRLKNRFNDLANELARSDRRRSLEGILPKLKQSQTVKKIDLKEDAKRKLFSGE